MRASTFKALAASALVAIAATSAATAADIAPRYTKAPPAMVEVWNWTGFYIGGNAGYNWQASNWVFGLEADAQWSDEKGGGVFNCAATLIGGPCLPGLTFLPAGVTGTSLAIDTHLEWFGTVRCCLSVLATP